MRTRQETSESLRGGSAPPALPCDLPAAPKRGRQQLLAAVKGQGGSRTRWKGDHVAFLLCLPTDLKSLTQAQEIPFDFVFLQQRWALDPAPRVPEDEDGSSAALLPLPCTEAFVQAKPSSPDARAEPLDE